MKTILVINDNSPEAEHAARFALNIAWQMQASVLLANTINVKQTAEKVPAGGQAETQRPGRNAAADDMSGGPGPEVGHLDISTMDEAQIAQVINSRDILMVIKGEPHEMPGIARKPDMNSLLNKIRCPVLLVPEHWQIKKVDRVVYIADLRFCRYHVIKFLAAMAQACDAGLSVAHLSAKGIPDMEEHYANSVFKKEVYDRLDYKQVFFNNIREKDLKKAVDVIINGMHNDILAMVNHRFHFEEILGRYLTDILPGNITVPVLIFPY